jgi:hypothetical protein
MVIKKFGQKNPWKLKELRRLQIPKQQQVPKTKHIHAFLRVSKQQQYHEFLFPL